MGKTIADLPALQAVSDETLIPVYQPGAADPAQKMKGKQFREFAEQAAEQYVEAATGVTQKAEQALAALGNDAQIAKKAAAAAADSEAKAKLYADQTEASVAGVASFNGRGGHVMPQSGDYTAAMVGAEPKLSYGKLTISTGTDEELITKLEAVIADMSDDTVRRVNVFFNAAHPVLAGGTYTFLISRKDAKYGEIIAFAYDYPTGIRMFKRSWANGWSVWTTDIHSRNVGDYAAPAGFGGFGEQLSLYEVSTNDDTDGTKFDAVIESLFSTMENGTSRQIRFSDYPHVSGATFVGTLFRASADYGVLFGQSYDTHIVIKSKSKGVWKPFEHVNPHMQLGVEYRTTERYMGKPVYVKLIDCGLSAAGADKTTSLGIENLKDIVSASGRIGNAIFPVIGSRAAGLEGGWNAWFQCSASGIGIFAGSNLGGIQCYATVRYTKTTD